MQFAQALGRACKAPVHKHKRGGVQLAGSGSVLLLTRVVKLVQALAVTVVHVVVLDDDGVLLGQKVHNNHPWMRRHQHTVYSLQ